MPPITVDPQRYSKIWTLDVLDQSWVEGTAREVDLIIGTLDLRGGERILDLACGFGRHALELARRGYPVVGVDITPAYVDEARKRAAEERLDASFICADLRQVSFRAGFDVAVNLADGAIGYLENDRENLKVFDLVAAALKPGGKHLLSVCNAAYARKHFPRRHWEMGSRSISLAEFEWDEPTSRMLYTGYMLRYGETLAVPVGTISAVRLYTLEELRAILRDRGLEVVRA